MSRALAFAALAVALALAGGNRLPAELFAPRSQQIEDGLGGELESLALPGDRLGEVVAAGDFNGDGRDDLAISDRESPGQLRMGAFHLLYGTPDGLPVGGNHFWFDFDPATGLTDREEDDEFAAALAAGDFDGDGFDDLAIGIPGEQVGAFGRSGVVLVLYGSVVGLEQSGAHRVRLGAGGIGGVPGPGDRFGAALAAGDFDADGRDDLAVGAPLYDVSGIWEDAGIVLALYGSAAGLDAADHRFFQQNSSGADGVMQDQCDGGDAFGAALAAGDFNADGRSDLAIGVPAEDLDLADVGLVQIVYAFAPPGIRGLRLTNNQAWAPTNVGTDDPVRSGERFGSVLAAGDLTGEGADDLAIGTPLDDPGLFTGIPDAGAVTVLFGQPGVGLHPSGSELLVQSDLAGGEGAEPFDRFGAALAIGDFVSGGDADRLDLAIGVTHEDVVDPDDGWLHVDAGAFHVVPGGATLDPGGAVLWTQGRRGSAGLEGPANFYGAALAAGDFDGDLHGDLAVGAPGRAGTSSTSVPVTEGGAAYVYYGALFIDGFESAGVDGWDGAFP